MKNWPRRLFILFPLLALLCLAAALFSQHRSGSTQSEFIPVSLHSLLEADYRANPSPARLPGLRLELIWDAISDREPQVDNLAARQVALLNSLQTPVPFVTPSACQGSHVIYASQDTWLNPARPTANYGAEPSLNIGRDGDQVKRILLFFPIGDSLPPGVYIKSAHLELTPVTAATNVGPLQLFSLAAPFSELTATWSQQPSPGRPYRTTVLPSSQTHSWDITAVVQDWLLDFDSNAGLLLEPAAAFDFTQLYYSREADRQTNDRVNNSLNPKGPRLVIDCGGQPPLPAAIAQVILPPTPSPTPTRTGSFPPLPPAAPTQTPVASPPPVEASPTLPPPSPTVLLPSPSPTQPPPLPSPSPTQPPPLPSPTPVPSTPDAPDEPDKPDKPTPTPTQLPPALTIDSVTVTEGDSGTVSAVFNVTLSAASGNPVTVDFATSDNTATAPADYLAASGSLTFAPGVTRQSITVLIRGDTLNEPDETFFVTLSNARNASIRTGQALGRIINDDPPPALSIGDITVPEGDSGAVEAIFTVALPTASGKTITVNYATIPGTALPGEDYLTASGLLTFPPGSLTQTISVPVIGDTVVEANETFWVELSNPTEASLANERGEGVILNDDGLTISIDDVAVTEGDSGEVELLFTVSLSSLSALPVLVEYATADYNAIAPADYTAIATTTLTFAPGVISRTIAVAVQDDTLHELDETFLVILANPSSGTLFKHQGVGAILDDDPRPTLTINDVTVTEGDSGVTNAIFTVFLEGPTTLTAAVNYATANGTAMAGSDYIAASGSLTFSPGITRQFITIQILGDTIPESNETFLVNLSNPTNAAIADGQGLGTIIDDDRSGDVCSSPIMTLTATADTHLRINQPNSNFGSDIDLRTRPITLNPRNTLIQFDLSTVPANSLITCAALLLNQTSAPETGQIIEIHRLMTGWVEDEATWRQRAASLPWATPGGDFDPIAAATFVPTTTNHAIGITSLAQLWADNSASNFGLLLLARNVGSNGEITYASRENGGNPPPRLILEYVSPLTFNAGQQTETILPDADGLARPEEKVVYLPLIVK